jgi:hypothetical protein
MDNVLYHVHWLAVHPAQIIFAINVIQGFHQLTAHVSAVILIVALFAILLIIVLNVKIIISYLIVPVYFAASLTVNSAAVLMSVLPVSQIINYLEIHA